MCSEKHTPAEADPADPAASVAAHPKLAARRPPKPRSWRFVILLVAALVVLVIGIPWVLHALQTLPSWFSPSDTCATRGAASLPARQRQSNKAIM